MDLDFLDCFVGEFPLTSELTQMHSERPKLYTILAFLSEIGLSKTGLLILGKGRVSIRGFSWYLNMSIIFWEQIATYKGHAPLQTLIQLELWFYVYYVLKVGGVFMHQSYWR